MTQFIKLTECNNGVVLINVDRIEHITKGSKSPDTYIKMLGNFLGKSEPQKETYFFVKESVEDIWIALNIGQNVVYDADTRKAMTNDK